MVKCAGSPPTASFRPGPYASLLDGSGPSLHVRTEIRGKGGGRGTGRAGVNLDVVRAVGYVLALVLHRDGVVSNVIGLVVHYVGTILVVNHLGLDLCCEHEYRERVE